MMALELVARAYFRKLREYNDITRTGRHIYEWDQLPEDVKTLTFDHIRNVLEHTPGQITPKIEHEIWRAREIDAGWRLGPVFSYEQKTNLLLVPYEKLSKKDKMIPKIFLDHVETYRDFLEEALKTKQIKDNGDTYFFGPVMNATVTNVVAA